MEIIKEYSNGEVTVVWKPALCVHSAKCFTGLPEVFRPSERPWIRPEKSDTKSIVEQVQKCPSGALSCFYLNEKRMPASGKTEAAAEGLTIEIRNNGPYILKGKVRLIHADGTTEIKNSPVLCRCGLSKRKPFCDGAHKNINPEEEMN